MDTKVHTQSASSKLSHIDIGKLARYSCILLTVIVQSSSPIEKEGQYKNLDKNVKHKLLDFSVCAKKCGLRPENNSSSSRKYMM